jgi:hypothetical protein
MRADRQPGTGLTAALRCGPYTARRRDDTQPAVVAFGRCAIINRTQALILGFFPLVVGSLVVILAAAPEVYDHALNLPPSWPGGTKIAFLIALSAFIALLSVGVLRRWRWTFWLILVAFLSGVLRVPVAILQLTGVMPANAPSWYVVFQGLIGLIQLAIGLAMLAGYRRSGPPGVGTLPAVPGPGGSTHPGLDPAGRGLPATQRSGGNRPGMDRLIGLHQLEVLFEHLRQRAVAAQAWL